jgi:hypothetical protein
MGMTERNGTTGVSTINVLAIADANDDGFVSSAVVDDLDVAELETVIVLEPTFQLLDGAPVLLGYALNSGVKQCTLASPVLLQSRQVLVH